MVQWPTVPATSYFHLTTPKDNRFKPMEPNNLPDVIGGSEGESKMRKMLIGIAAVGALTFATAANAGPGERTLSGAAIGAGTGAVVAGPVGAVAGGVIGAVVGGPRISRHRSCWYGRHNVRHCRSR
jgi:hypothetical protein